MEKAALEDPFLADALEGYALPNLATPADLSDLQKRLQTRIQHATDEKVVVMKGSRGFPWLRAAAAIILVAGAGWLTYRLGADDKNEQSIADAPVIRKETPAAPQTATDTVTKQNIQQPATDSSVTTITSPVPQTVTTYPADSVVTEDYQQIVPAKAANDDRRKQATDAQPVMPGITYDAKKEVARTEEQLEGKVQGLTITPQSRSAFKTKPNVDALNNSQARRQGFTERNIYRGQVMDNNNQPLPFANVTNARDGVGTYADAKGNFVLTSTDSVLNVKVRSVGFETNEVALQRNGTQNQVVLEEDQSRNQALVLNSRQLNTNRSRSSTMVFEESEPQDGWENYDAYLVNNLRDPDGTTQMKRANTGGEVSVSFEVNEYGEPVNLRIEKSLCDVCDKEAIRLIKEGPRWKRKAGKRVTVSVPFG